jgi:hypothetical protein
VEMNAWKFVTSCAEAADQLDGIALRDASTNGGGEVAIFMKQAALQRQSELSGQALLGPGSPESRACGSEHLGSAVGDEADGMRRDPYQDEE